VSDVSLETALGICFRNLPLTYKIIDKTVVIRRTAGLPIPTETAESAIDIRGRVTGTDGEPLTGVSIRLAGTTTGTTSNENGQYILTVPDGTGTLIFSYVGYITQEVTIDNRSVIDVQLAEDANALNEVVVTALGITRDKKVLAYSISEVDGEGFTK